MAQKPLKDSFLDLERHLQLLEANVEKLRTSLQHWQTWSAEYEGLKEEVSALEKPAAADLYRLTETYEGELVTSSEIEDILGIKGASKSARNVEQVINVLDRRIDYVSQNIKTVEKQLSTAEEKVEKAAVVGRPEVRNEEGLPLMEIFEELDEDGNIIEGRVEAHGSSKGLLEEVLKKAGVKESSHDSALKTGESPVEVIEAKQDEVVYKVKATPRQPERQPKKQVSFSEQSEPEEVPVNAAAIKDAERVARKLTAVMERAADLNEPIRNPVVPINESLEDAKLRQEMLDYGMSEVGSVVAELDLEDESDISDSGYDDEDEDTESLEEEDAFGRSTRSVINDDIRAEMRALEEKLGLKLMANVGADPNVEPKSHDHTIPDSPATEIEAALKVALSNPEPDVPESIVKKGKANKSVKKGVRFAEELDISPAPDTSSAQSTENSKIASIPVRAPVADIVERAPESTLVSANNLAEQPKKISRFKASRSAGPSPTPFIPPAPVFLPTRTREVPSGPRNTTLSEVIVEKEIPLGDAPEPDMHDPALLQQQVATEYYKKRNLMVQKEGGFRDLDEEDEERTGRVEFTEEEGGPRKMSRFMAARLARQQ